MTAALRNLMGVPGPELAAWFESFGEKPYRSQQAMRWLYQRRVVDFAEFTDMSKSLRARLAAEAEIAVPEVVSEQLSADGTRKWLLDVGAGNAVETVFIPEASRGTLCISSQVGCALNCTFCATAQQGFNRNLSAAEIVGQIWHAAHALGHSADNRVLTNIVFMGMGEPLANFEALLPALSVLTDDYAFGFARKRVTVSTAGMVPAIDRLAQVAPGISLAVSLHAPDDEARTKLVPLNRKYPVASLLDACRRYVADQHKARITFEYTLIDGVNDSEQQAHGLVRLLRSVPSKLNIIPFNPFPGARWRGSPPERIERFQKIVLASGQVATVRKTRGDDIAAACGQLAGQVRDRTRRSRRLAA